MSNIHFTYRPVKPNRSHSTRMTTNDYDYTVLPVDENGSFEDMRMRQTSSCLTCICQPIASLFRCICPEFVVRYCRGCCVKRKCKNAMVVTLVFIANLFGLEEDVVQRLQRNFRFESEQDLRQERLEEEIQFKKLEELNNVYQTQIDELKKELDNFKAKEESLIIEIRMLRVNLETVKKEKETALSRLSEMAGAKLRHNNPGIADLSDENRPNKLAEKFNELYDNEWTEAFEVLEGFNLTEKEVIAKLLACIQEIYYRCKTKAANQRKELCKAAIIKTDEGHSSGSSIALKKISDLQKQLSFEILDVIIQELMTEDTFLQRFKLEVEKCARYIKTGIQLCWLMNVQDPPVVLNFNFNTGDNMDTNIVKAYTKTGTKVNFLVWPPMYLHEAGPLLQKGVLQPL